MAETMYAAPGVGLAATQVDVHKRIVVIDASETRDRLVVLINPEIVAREGVQYCEEGCLSVPGIYEAVERAESITVRALGLDGQSFTLDAEGMLAVCIQHELDHLEGKVFVDYLSRLKQQRIKAKLQKQIRKTACSGVEALRILFAGTPEFAARSLAAVLDSRHEVCCVMTQPDRPAGRGLATAASPVKKLALARGIPVVQPATLKEVKVRDELASHRPDAIVTAAFGLIFPRAILDIPSRGSINVHASLLPRWRGAAPVQRALLAGDRVTGVSIMQMDAGLDTGPVLLKGAIPVSDDDTAGTLTDRLAALGGELVVRALDALEAGGLRPVPQPDQGASYAPKLDKRESRLDWNEDALAVHRRVRAFNPAPGARAIVRGVELKIWTGSPAAGSGQPGEVLSADSGGLCVACGSGALRLTELQRPGGKRLHAAEFLRGFPLSPGERFES